MNQISDKATLMPGVILGDDVIIEEDVYIDYYCIIRDHVRIGRGSYIGARCILGEYLADFVNRRERNPHPLTIGKGAVIRSESIIYGDTVIGARFQTGHRVTSGKTPSLGMMCASAHFRMSRGTAPLTITPACTAKCL